MTVFCGIDPGFSGAICLYDPSKDWMEIHDCPVLKVNGHTEMCLSSIKDILQSVQIKTCVIEKSWARPNGGAVSAMFNYGMGVGEYRGIIHTLSIPYTRISPQEWKKKLRVPSDKDGARARASELMPQHASKWMRKKDHGRAEAALLAYFAANPP